MSGKINGCQELDDHLLKSAALSLDATENITAKASAARTSIAGGGLVIRARLPCRRREAEVVSQAAARAPLKVAPVSRIRAGCAMRTTSDCEQTVILGSQRCEVSGPKALEGAGFRTATSSLATGAGVHQNTGWSWKEYWVGLCCQMNPFITRTGSGTTTGPRTLNCGLDGSQQVRGSMTCLRGRSKSFHGTRNRRTALAGNTGWVAK